MGILNVQGVVAPRDGHCLHLITLINIYVWVYGVEVDLWEHSIPKTIYFYSHISIYAISSVQDYEPYISYYNKQNLIPINI